MKEKLQILLSKAKTKLVLLRRHGKLIATMAAVLLLAIWGISAFIIGQEDSGVAEAATELEQLADNVRRHYQTKPDYWGLNTQTVIEKKIYPLAMLKEGSLVGYMGNKVLVGQGAEGGLLMPGARNFDISYPDLTAKQCVELAGYKFTPKFWLGVSGISVLSNQQETLFTWDDEANQLPIGKDRARAVCANHSTIIWHF